ncbi:hypothetical protein PR048_005936 [Dryococelus australis]|uniref:Uncharacterized protein n=1 Tax=Dryococelus australis TaxID=614101 RepID=A0ABQ9I9J6_9NEOP|nr:hypothetical protein PR048_005936 [Dryococelus australis]
MLTAPGLTREYRKAHISQLKKPSSSVSRRRCSWLKLPLRVAADASTPSPSFEELATSRHLATVIVAALVHCGLLNIPGELEL